MKEEEKQHKEDDTKDTSIANPPKGTSIQSSTLVSSAGEEWPIMPKEKSKSLTEIFEEAARKPVPYEGLPIDPAK